MASVDLHDGARRERAAIAAQACQTCRNRKSKCDEQRPKCGLCRRLNVDCEYREPLPTKKDKTMVHILDTLARLENKFDNLALSGGGGSGIGDTPSMPRASISGASSSQASLAVRHIAKDSDLAQSEVADANRSYQHLTVPHKIMLWPGIYIHLINSGIAAANDLQHVLQEGTPWFIKQEILKHPDSLPAHVGLPCFAVNVAAREQGHASNVAFPTLNIQHIQEFSDAYFNTFNILFPLFNRESFMNDLVAKLLREGYSDGDSGSVLALLVFALGQVAIEGVFDRPITVVNGQPSGFRGGTVDEPPGLAIFNEARRRVGFISTQCSLENVQIMLLQAMYFESNARHLDFWRCTVAASMACQVLIRCENIDWNSPRGDLIKRAYWVCVLSEDLYHLDLDLPQTGIHTLEDEVPLPYFQLTSDNAQRNLAADERSHFQYHFLAMIALRRLIARIHGVIHESSTTQTETADDYSGPPAAVIREMVRQLDSWRALLPRPLQWSDNDRFEFPTTDPTARRPNESLFAPDQGSIPIGHKFHFDIVTAQLRTRFYYARYIMYRPFVYKALHFPELMTAEDANCCAMAIKSACCWPMAMAPPKNKKRLVPHLFAWTQNFMGILLILRMTVENDCLRQICEEHVNREEVEKTAGLLLDWMRDVKQLDGVAEWCWKIMEPLYSGRPNPET